MAKFPEIGKKVGIILVLSFLIVPATATATEDKQEIIQCNCGSFTRKHSIYWFPQVENVSEIPALERKPKLGSIALFQYASTSHAGVVFGINRASNTIIVLESNYRKCEITRREISLKDNKFLRGFYWY